MATVFEPPAGKRIHGVSPISAPPEQHAMFVELLKQLRLIQAKPHRKPCLLLGPKGEHIELPEAVFYALERVVDVLARGDAITVVPVGKELTTQHAANLLNVSRQYLVRLLEEGKIPYTKTGKHRRLRIEDVLAYKRQRAKERRAKLKELTALTEELGGYPELE
ncbi:helix-turn-helix domain-containing protein [Pendulispora albinea]|uniref:Helix-turn-helix domain-containing protein n=1 Tax=Pendulispora albinea TaxID=2741071 RepID=A0ABZ2M5W0_9BACT